MALQSESVGRFVNRLAPAALVATPTIRDNHTPISALGGNDVLVQKSWRGLGLQLAELWAKRTYVVSMHWRALAYMEVMSADFYEHLRMRKSRTMAPIGQGMGVTHPIDLYTLCNYNK